MSRTEEFTFRIEPRTNRMIKKQLVSGSKLYDSKSEFASEAIQSNAPAIRHEVNGSDLLQDLCELLTDVEGFHEEIPKIHHEGRLGKDESKKHVSVKIPDRVLSIVGDVQDETQLDRSTVCRMCVFKQLFEIATHPAASLLYDDQEQLVISTWGDIETSLISIESRFAEILHRRFVRKPETTSDIAKRDQQRFERFASRYCEEFLDTDFYSQLRETYGSERFQATERVIEKMTGRRCSGFLEAELDKLEN